jgi:thioredoxin-related protein
MIKISQRNMRNIVIAAAVAILAIASPEDLTAQQGTRVHWYGADDFEMLIAKNDRPIFIDAYTDWCGWCKKLDQDTFSDPVIAEYLNENFYPVKFNAESKDPVKFMGREFVNDGNAGKAHQLAVALMQGRMSYPTVIFLNEKGELLAPVPGYRGPADFEPLLVYFGEGKYLEQKFDEFTKTFTGKVSR